VSAFVFRELAPVFIGVLLFFIVLWVITPFKVPKGRPLTGRDALVGSEGEALSDVHKEGKVRVAGGDLECHE
jgi:membrane-bound ClpP family serine protease